MNGQDRVASVVGPLQHRLQLEPIDRSGSSLDIDREIREHRLVRILRQQLDQAGGVLQTLLEIVERSYPALETLDLLDLLARTLAVRPECGVGLAGLEIKQACLATIEVKETPSARPSAA